MWAKDFIGNTNEVAEVQPIPMLLFCPNCDQQHIDEATPDICETCGKSEADCSCPFFKAWLNEAHKSHRCMFCNHVWRPSDVPINGVAAIQTKGKLDGSAYPRGARNVLVACSHCGGKGYNEGFINARPRHYYGKIKCGDCKGTGQITGEMAERIRTSKSIVLDRRARRVTIREEAARLGIDFGEWSRVERGRMPELDRRSGHAPRTPVWGIRRDLAAGNTVALAPPAFAIRGGGSSVAPLGQTSFTAAGAAAWLRRLEEVALEPARSEQKERACQ